MYSLLLQAPADYSLYSNNTVMFIGAGILGMLVWWMYKLKKSQPEADWGPLIASTMVDKHETIFMALIFFEYVATSIIAATVHAPGRTGLEMNPLGRILLHLLISVGGTVAQFTLARDVAILFIKQDWGDKLGHFITGIFITVLAFGIPYLNLFLIAASSGETVAFQTWVYSLTHSQEACELLYARLGYPPNYNPVANLSPILLVCISSGVIVHYGYTFVEAIRTISSKKRRTKLLQRVRDELKEDKKDEKKDDKDPATKKTPMPGQERQVEQLISNAEFLLSRIGYELKSDKIKAMAKEIQSRVLRGGGEEAPEARQAASLKLAARLAALKVEAQSIDASTDANKAERKRELEEKIRKFISGPNKGADNALLPVESRGLGIAIKK